MKKPNFTKRLGLLKIALTLSLMLLFTAPLFAQGGGLGRHHRNDSVPPPPPPPPPPHWNDSVPPPPFWNDSVPPPPPPPPHGDSTRRHWNDSVPINDSLPPPHRCDSLHGKNDSMHWNDSVPFPPFWGDTIHPRHCGGDSNNISVDRMQKQAIVNIYPNPIVESSNLHIENASGNLTFNLYQQTGRLVLTSPGLTNGNVRLNNNGLIPGIYIYELRNDNSIVSTGRVVIQ